MWEDVGRDWVGQQLSLDFVDGHWRRRPEILAAHAQAAYRAELTLLPVTVAAHACEDEPLLNELSEVFDETWLRLPTVGTLRESEFADERALARAGDSRHKTLWWSGSPTNPRVRECPICNAQFFFAAARLVRAFAELGVHDSTSFLERWWPTLVDGHVVRQALVVDWPSSSTEISGSRVERWQALRAGRGGELPPHERSVVDLDLFLIAAAAELLLAAHHDPRRLPLRETQRRQLAEVVREGSALLEWVDSEGRMPTFAGDFDEHPIYAHSGYDGETRPTSAAPGSNMGWDVSHATRIPIVLRSLADARQVAQLTYPSDAELRAVVHHFSEQVVRDGPVPSLHDFMDGSDGWLKVRPQTAFAPLSFCDATTQSRKCVGTTGWNGWGLLAEHDAELMAKLRTLVEIAEGERRIDWEEVDRLYSYNGAGFRVSEPGRPGSPLVLWIMGFSPAQFACPQDAAKVP